MTEQDQRAALLDAALRYLDQGFSVIPIFHTISADQDSKTPVIKWKDYQTRLPTEDEVLEWWPDDGRKPSNLGICTGAVSGVIVLDCDDEAAMAWADAHGLRSPVRVKTRRGEHRYFGHPGVETRNRAKIGGQHLDLRGDGGYVVMPPSINEADPANPFAYELVMELDWDELPTWPGAPDRPEEWDFARLDLTHIPLPDPELLLSADERARLAVERRHGVLLEDGCGRNRLIMARIRELVAAGLDGAELDAGIAKFQSDWFADELDERSLARAVSKILAKRDDLRVEARREADAQVAEVKTQEAKRKVPRPLYARDLGELAKRVAEQRVFIHPWLPERSIVQVVSYTGSGKSLWLSCLMWLLAMGKSLGPYLIKAKARVLYIDLENGRATLHNRLPSLLQMFGDPGEDFAMQASSWGEFTLNLRTDEGRALLEAMLYHHKPDVVVVDTVRTAFTGLEENKAESWSMINGLLLHMRNAGLTVVVVHHTNKPTQDGTLGREAGSSNQLTVIETQVKIMGVHHDKQRCIDKGFLCEPEKWALLVAEAARRGARLVHAIKMDFGKVRECPVDFEPIYMGWTQTDYGFGPIVFLGGKPRTLRVWIADELKAGRSPEDVRQSPEIQDALRQGRITIAQVADALSVVTAQRETVPTIDMPMPAFDAADALGLNEDEEPPPETNQEGEGE